MTWQEALANSDSAPTMTQESRSTGSLPKVDDLLDYRMHARQEKKKLEKKDYLGSKTSSFI